MPTQAARNFDLLFQEYFDPLTRQVARMVECEHVAQELVQDVFLRMWRGRGELEVRGEFGSYLRRAARNRALDWLRHQDLHREWEQRELVALQDGTVVCDATDGRDDIGDVDETMRLQAALTECLAAMPERRRLVCDLRWRHELGPAAIAARLGISVKTVENHITQGAKDVRARLRPS
jgi:RNA polymerase sigma-70 factor (ECF subfamily)